MYIAGFFLTVSVESALAVAEEAFSANKLFMMNLAAPFIPQFFKEALDKMSPFWDIIFGNESEATAFATAQGWEETDVEAIALRTAALPKKNEKRSRIVVYTQGAQPTIVVVDGKATQVLLNTQHPAWQALTCFLLLFSASPCFFLSPFLVH